MTLTEKAKIYYNVWCCSHRRRHNAKIAENWDLYDRENDTLRMCMSIANWWKFDTEGKKFL